VIAEPGPVTRALIAIVHQGDDHFLAAQICRACVDGLDVDGAAISLLTATDAWETLSTTDATAATVEDLQFTLGEGACIEAAVSGRPVLIPDLHDHGLTARWPVFAAALAEQTDVRALFALPLQLGTINLGVLDLYRTAPGPLHGHELRDVVAAADTATVMLLDTSTQSGDGHREGRQSDRRRTDDASGEAHPRDAAWWDGLYGDRVEVHQATGMILAQLDIPAQDAFVRLRAYAFSHRRPLREVARDVVGRRLVFTEDMT
jgi:ANTAR domain/GAF domain